MKNHLVVKKLQSIVNSCDAVILYRPLGGEVDYSIDSLPIKLVAERFLLTNEKTSNPIALAKFCTDKYEGSNVYLLVPGTRFDIFGSRHGRGGGWYDRFLSKIPKNWIRIGVGSIATFSTIPIIKNTWDQSMDWLLIFDGTDWMVYETKAR